MSLWDFVGGAADAVLDKRKRDMAAQLQKDLEEQRRNFQMSLEQQRAERENDRFNIQAESQRLERDARREETAAERAARQKEMEDAAALRREELNFRREDSAASRAAAAAEREAEREDRRLYREGLASQAAGKQESQLVSSLIRDIESLSVDKTRDEVYKDAVSIKNDPNLPASEKIKLLDAMLKRKLTK